MVEIKNTRSGGLGLPGGPVIAGGETLTADQSDWNGVKNHPTVKAWIDAGLLAVSGDDGSDSYAYTAVNTTAERENHIETLDQRFHLQVEASVALQREKEGLEAKATTLQAEKASLEAKVTELESEKVALAIELEGLRASSPQQPAPDREALKKQATELGVSYPHNVTDAKLKDLINAKLASNSGSAS